MKRLRVLHFTYIILSAKRNERSNDFRAALTITIAHAYVTGRATNVRCTGASMRSYGEMFSIDRLPTYIRLSLYFTLIYAFITIFLSICIYIYYIYAYPKRYCNGLMAQSAQFPQQRQGISLILEVKATYRIYTDEYSRGIWEASIPGEIFFARRKNHEY